LAERVPDIHGNFIVNEGGATANDVEFDGRDSRAGAERTRDDSGAEVMILGRDK
jgi:hypothetical protein